MSTFVPDGEPAALHVLPVVRSIVSLLTVIPVNDGPQSPPAGGTGTGTPTRPASGQLWPRGDGVPRT